MDAPNLVLKPDRILLFTPALISVNVSLISSLVISRLLGGFVCTSDYKVFPIIIVMRPAASLIGC
jgi:hypothetical protein